MRRKRIRDREHHRYVKPPVGNKALWQAVLFRQIRDAFGIEKGYKRKAMVWLFSDASRYVDSRNKVSDWANIYWDSWSDQIKKTIKMMGGCDYILIDGERMNGREVAKYICKMLARSGND